MHFFDFSKENICVFKFFVVILQAFSRKELRILGHLERLGYLENSIN